MDVCVTCPFSSSNVGRDSPNEYCASHLKHRKYDPDFVGTNFDFSALVFESTGAVNREGKEFLAQLFRFAARYSGNHLSVFAGRAWARLSCTLQSAVAQSVINRTPAEFDDQPSPTLFSDDSEDSIPAVSVCSPLHDNQPASPVHSRSYDPKEATLLRASAPSFIPSAASPPIPRYLLLTCDANLWQHSVLAESSPVPVFDSGTEIVKIVEVHPEPVQKPEIHPAEFHSEQVFVNKIHTEPVAFASSGPRPYFTSKNSTGSVFGGPLQFASCPATSPDGLRCPRGSSFTSPIAASIFVPSFN